MTFTIPGEEPVGYTFQEDNYPADKILDALRDAQWNKPDYNLRTVLIMQTHELHGDDTEAALRSAAVAFGIEYDDPRSYDTDDFPKPIYADQLRCSDEDWTDLAPDHQWGPFGLAKKYQTCQWCGKERTS